MVYPSSLGVATHGTTVYTGTQNKKKQPGVSNMAGLPKFGATVADQSVPSRSLLRAGNPSLPVYPTIPPVNANPAGGAPLSLLGRLVKAITPPSDYTSPSPGTLGYGAQQPPVSTMPQQEIPTAGDDSILTQALGIGTDRRSQEDAVRAGRTLDDKRKNVDGQSVHTLFDVRQPVTSESLKAAKERIRGGGVSQLERKQIENWALHPPFVPRPQAQVDATANDAINAGRNEMLDGSASLVDAFNQGGAEMANTAYKNRLSTATALRDRQLAEQNQGLRNDMYAGSLIHGTQFEPMGPSVGRPGRWVTRGGNVQEERQGLSDDEINRRRGIMEALRANRAQPAEGGAAPVGGLNTTASPESINARGLFAPQLEVGSDATLERLRNNQKFQDASNARAEGKKNRMGLVQAGEYQKRLARQGRLEDRANGPDPLMMQMMQNPRLAAQMMALQSSAALKNRELDIDEKYKNDLLNSNNRMTPMERETAIQGLMTGGNYTRQQAEDAINRAGGMGATGAPGTPGVGAPGVPPGMPTGIPKYNGGSIPPELSAASDPQDMAEKARRMGYSDEDITAMVQTLTGRKTANAKDPDGTGLWDVLTNPKTWSWLPGGNAQGWGDWWNNR